MNKNTKKFSFPNLIHGLFLLLPYLNVLLFIKGIYDFTTAKNIYIINLLLLIPLFLFDIKKKSHTGFWIFILSLLYSLPWIIFGIDMTDESYNLTISWFYPVKWDFVASTSQTSYMLSHLWLKLIGTPSVLWERLAVNTILATIMFFSYKTLLIFKPDFRNKHLLSIAIFFSMAIAAYNWYRFLVPYDKIPMLLTIMFFYFWYSGIKQDNKTNLTISGILFMLALYSKITYFFIIPLIPVISIINYKSKINLIKYFGLGLIGGLILLIFSHTDLFYAFSGLKKTISYQDNTPLCLREETHTIDLLVNSYIKETTKLLPFFIYSLGIILISQITKFIRKEKYIFWIANGVVFLLLGGVTIWAIYNFHYPKEYLKWFWSLFGLFLALILTALISDFKYWKNNADLLINLGIILIAAFIGSNVGFRKIHFNYAIAFVLPIIIGISFNKIDKKIVFYSLLYFAAIGGILNYKYVYRDYPINKLNTQFTIKPLRGIFSINTKVTEIESFYKNLKEENIPEGQYITTNKTFLFPFLLDKRPMGVCWQVNDSTLSSLISQGKGPDYVIFSTTSMRRRDWNRKVYLAIPKDKKRISHIQQLLESYMDPIISSPKNIFILYRKKL